MTEQEMAEEYVNKNNIEWELECHRTSPIGEVIQAFLAGLKAGRPKWHDLRKDPTDLPKDKHNVWCQYLDQYEEGWYDKDTNTWTLIYRDYHIHCIEAWCELPTFEKE